MAFKKFLLDEQTAITIYKKRGSRYMRISIKGDGSIRLTIPTWVPYGAGLKYAQSKYDWIKTNQQTDVNFKNGHRIGKSHTVKIVYSENISDCSVRVDDNYISVKLGKKFNIDDVHVQNKIKQAGIRALRKQAELYLPERVNKYCEIHNFKTGSISIKNLKGRWGSCDRDKNIVLNLHLMHLPWELIDYVIHHELTHTKIMQHGPVFWNEMRRIWPDVDKHRRDIKQYQPNFTNN